jgi:hypothetical protein
VAPDRKALGNACPELLSYRGVFDVLRLLPPDDGSLNQVQVLYRQDPGALPRMCIPTANVSDLIEDFHDTVAHHATDHLVAILKQSTYWPRMYSDVQDQLLRCHGCMQKHCHCPLRKMLHQFHPKDRGFTNQIVFLDVAGPLPTTPDGNKWILGLQDRFTGYTELVAIKNKTAMAVSIGFRDGWIFRHGTPVSIHSDNEWTAKTFQEMCKDHGILHTTNPPYNPRSNGAVEKAFGTLKGLLRACLRGINQDSWDQWLPKIAFAMNITIHSGLMQTPFR